jgi:hypothetical protein
MMPRSRSIQLALSVLVAIALAACGSSSSKTPKEQAAEHLQVAYDDYGNGDVPQAMADLDASIAAEVSPEALLLRGQLEWLRGDVETSQATIAGYKVLYPTSGAADVFEAYAQDVVGGSCSTIYERLDTARSLDMAGLGCGDFWGMIESDPEFPNPNFDHFRTSCAPQFGTLLAKKACLEEAPGATCKENVNKWDSTLWVARLFIDHNNTIIIKATGSAVGFAARFVPGPYAKIVAYAIQMEIWRTVVWDKGCGVKLSWQWAQFASPGTALLYWAGPQK